MVELVQMIKNRKKVMTMTSKMITSTIPTVVKEPIYIRREQKHNQKKQDDEQRKGKNQED